VQKARKQSTKRKAPPPIGQQILELRKQWGWNQTLLARKVQVRQSQVSQWENGQQRPGFLHLCKLSVVFQAPITVLAHKGTLVRVEPIDD